MNDRLVELFGVSNRDATKSYEMQQVIINSDDYEIIEYNNFPKDLTNRIKLNDNKFIIEFNSLNGKYYDGQGYTGNIIRTH